MSRPKTECKEPLEFIQHDLQFGNKEDYILLTIIALPLQYGQGFCIIYHILLVFKNVLWFPFTC